MLIIYGTSMVLLTCCSILKPVLLKATIFHCLVWYKTCNDICLWCPLGRPHAQPLHAQTQMPAPPHEPALLPPGLHGLI